MSTQLSGAAAQSRAARRSVVRWAVALTVPAVLMTGAWSRAAGRLAIAPESRLWVDGTSTVRSFTCGATKLEGGATFQGAAGAELAEFGRTVDAVELQVPVAALDCRNRTMNEHMRKALKAAEHPTISYRLTSHEVRPRAEGGLAVTMTGALTLAGKAREISMTADAVPDSGGRFRITGSEELVMSEFGVKPPTLMLGTMKVHDKVVVRYEIVLTPAPAIAAGP